MTSRAAAYGMVSLVATLLGGVATAFSQQPYEVVDHWKLGGRGGWDYLTVDPGAHLLYVTHGPRVEVLDTNTGKPVAAITGLKGTHGVALDVDGRFGYVSDGQANDVLIFDRKTFAAVGTVPAGTNPDGILFEPRTKSVWAFNGRSNDVTVIDAASRKVIATLKLPGKPEFPQANGKGDIFVNIEDANSIVHLDAVKKVVVATWKLTSCKSPSGMAIDAAHHRVFSVCDGKKMVVVDTATGEELAMSAIGDGPDAADYSAAHQLAFSSNGEGTLTIVDAANGYKPVQTVATEKGARTMSYDSATDRIYLVTARFGARPAATAANPHPWPAIVPDSFTVLVVGRR